MKTVTSCFRSVAAVFLAFAASVHPQVFAQQGSEPDPGKTIIVLDASGSMWGEVPGGVKIDIAKKVVTDLVKDLNPKMQLGLMAYGHRQKGDCTDIELLVPPAANNHQDILDAVQALIPKGKTPLSDAVLQAAEFLQYEEQKASVILVSDGEETCDRDPCALGDLLAAKGIDFVCHVVGFDLKDDEKRDLVCLAESTGGMFLEASDADSLMNSLNTAVETVMAPETSLVLVAKAGEGEGALSGVKFEIFQKKGAAAPLHFGNGGAFKKAVDPGTYFVTASLQDLKADAEIEVPEGKSTTHEFILKATGLTARAVYVEGGEPIEKGLSWKLWDQPKGTRDRKTIAFSYHAQPKFVVPGGTYYLGVGKGETEVEKEIQIEDNQGEDVTLVLNAGFLVAIAKMTEDSDPIERGLSWKLLLPPNTEGKREQYAFSYHGETDMIVPEGRYLLKVDYDKSSAEQEVEVQAGETTRTTLILGAGTLTSSASLTEGGEILEKSMKWAVLGPPNIEGKREQVAFSYDGKPVFKLPAGAYLLRAQYGEAEAEKEVEVKSGETTEISLVMGAGFATGVAYYAEAGGDKIDSGGVKWTVLGPPNIEGKRETVSYQTGPTPKFSLPGGSYTMKTVYGYGEVEMPFEVKSGETTEVVAVLGVGSFKGEARLAENSPDAVQSGSLKWHLMGAPGIEGKRKQIAYGTGPSPQWMVPRGDYLLRLVLGEASTEKDITITAGQMTQEKLVLNAGLAHITAPADLGSTSFSVYPLIDTTEQRRHLAYSTSKDYEIFLPEGKYLVELKLRQANETKTLEFEIQAGQRSEVSFE